MKFSAVLIEQKDPYSYSISLSGSPIAFLRVHIKYDFLFYISRTSFYEIKIGDEIFFLKCLKSGAAGNGAGYIDFVVVSKDNKKIGNINITTSLFGLIIKRNAFFTRTNKINYLTYYNNETVSIWQNENKNDVLILQNETVSFKEDILNEKMELYLLTTLTVIIDKLLINKIKKGITGNINVVLIFIFLIVCAFYLLK